LLRINSQIIWNTWLIFVIQTLINLSGNWNWFIIVVSFAIHQISISFIVVLNVVFGVSNSCVLLNDFFVNGFTFLYYLRAVNSCNVLSQVLFLLLVWEDCLLCSKLKPVPNPWALCRSKTELLCSYLLLNSLLYLALGSSVVTYAFWLIPGSQSPFIKNYYPGFSQKLEPMLFSLFGLSKP